MFFVKRQTIKCPQPSVDLHVPGPRFFTQGIMRATHGGDCLSSLQRVFFK